VRDGFLPKSELTFLELDVAASRTNVNKAEVALNESKTQLQWLVGGPPDSALEIVGEIEYQRPSASEDSIVTLAIAQRSELKENSARQVAATAELGLARGERIPNLTVSAFYSRERSVFGAENFIGNPGGIQGLKDVDNLFGIRVSLPLPLIDRRHAEIAKAQNQGAIIAATNLGLENQIRFEARNAYRALKSSEKTVDLLQQVQTESDSLMQLLQSAYAQGRVTVSDYLTHKERLVNSRLNLYDATAGYLAAQKEFERAVELDWNQMQQGDLK
jgi:cobalt-zinc-cadmium efflux system outer membrane protein